jgi:C-terminal processing protease CtpA/Prc
MINKLLAGIALVLVVVAVGLETILSEANDAYGQWMSPADLNEMHQNMHHSVAGFTAEGNNQKTITKILINKP